MTVPVVPVISPRPAAAVRHRADVGRLPRSSRLRTAVAERLVRHAVGGLPLRMRLGGAEPAGRGGPLLEVRDPHAFFRRIGVNGMTGFGESYLAGEWDTPDLVGVLTVFAEHGATLLPAPLRRLRGLWAGQPGRHRSTAEAGRADTTHHHELPNELFGLFLDDTLSCSSALFRGFPAEQHLLSAAQHRKIDRLLDLGHVGPGTQLLEIGTGWGELAIRAAARGARVLTVTLSAQQRALAVRRVQAAGLADRVTVLLRDHRKVLGRYDAIVSAEMTEAVSAAEFWPEYFMTLDRLLAPGGRVALQAVTMPHERMLASRDARTWFGKYLYPGGLLPSTEVMERIAAGCTGLRVTARDAFGPHYAETLRLWRERFTAHTAQADRLGFDETFRRMWNFHLAHSEAGFRSGHLDVLQLQLTKGPAVQD